MNEEATPEAPAERTAGPVAADVRIHARLGRSSLTCGFGSAP
ncbi:MAG TPA: hypothetical protein VIG41_02655 [Micrococcaceae bacterium]